MESKIKYPDVIIEPTYRGEFALGIVSRAATAMRVAGISEEGIKRYIEEATKGNYDHLILTTKRYVTVN